MRSLKNELRLHYRCAFQVRGATIIETFGALIREIRQWLTDTRKIPPPAVRGAWFFNEGEWASPGQEHITIRTSRVEGTNKLPSWAIRYEHPSNPKFETKTSAENFRVWRTDIALNCENDQNVLFSLQTAHYLLSSYFGPEPAEPEPNSPGIVKQIIQSDVLRTFSGSEPLLTRASTIAPNDAAILLQRVLDPERKCPLIYISREYQTGEPAINAHNLAWGLAGLATTYVAESSWVDKTTEQIFPEAYRCWNGKLRIYMPGVNPQRPDDHKRHRYFTPEQLHSLGDKEIQKILTRSLARRLLYTFDHYPRTIDDLRYLKQQNHLQILRNKANVSQSHEEMVAVLNELNTELMGKNEEQERQLRSTQDRVDVLELTQQDLETKLGAAEYAAQTAREQLVHEAKANQRLQSELTAFQSLRQLPRTINDCGEFARKAFPDKLAFTDRGRAALHKASYLDIEEFWETLWAMSAELHDLFFDPEKRSGDIEKRFKDLTGIELSMTEGKLTKADKKLMRTRKDSYQGEELDITPHIKLRNRNEHFRIYFGISHSKRLLVIGDCTDHLETAGTRRNR